MRRAGLILIAAVVIAVGLLLVLAGVAVAFAMYTNSGTPQGVDQHAWQVFSRTLGMIFGAGFAGLGVWAILAGIALVQRKRWARISVVVICALSLTLCVPFLILAAVVPFLPNRNGWNPDYAAEAFGAFFWILPTAFAIWAIVFLNRRTTKEEFGIESLPVYLPPPPPPVAMQAAYLPEVRRRPVLVSVIAWFMIITGAVALSMAPFYWLWKSWLPTLVFGRLVWGWPVLCALIAQTAVSIAAGVGLLKAKNWGRILTIVVHAYGVVNILLMLWNRGPLEQYEKSLLGKMSEIYSRAGIPITPEMLEPFTRIMWVSMLMSLPIPLLIIWYMVKQKDLGAGTEART
jgi:hypothetical protein